ncbi:MAG TPA: MIP/aquaporin family protein [Bacillota bacterium]|nr:MIP/aquaporin family protein [Bacillota bacterium]HPW41788.1 MIP/aquaporin family protein [Bacillota bacterium]
MSQFIAELIGVAIIIIFGGGVVAGCLLNKSKANNAGWMVIITGWGVGVATAVYATGTISGAHLNPAVTIALASIGQFPWAQVPSYIIAQLLGGIVGGIIVWLAYLPHWAESSDKGAKLAVFSTGPAIRNSFANVLCEIIGTVVLVLGILAIGANKLADGLNPLLVGVLVVGIGASLGGPTGYAINPARDLGPRIAHAILPIAGKGDSDWKYSWVPVIGPIIGGLLGAFIFTTFLG